MFKYFVWSVGIAFFAVACNSYNVEGKPEITADPPKWSVDYVLRAADATGTYDDDGVTRNLRAGEFVISNKGETGELQIFSINLLTPNGRIVGKTGVDADIARLFSMARSTVDSKGKVVSGESAGFSAIDGFSLDNHNNNSGKFLVAPLCPLNDPLAPLTTACRKGFDAAKYNTFVKVKVNYKELAAAIYKDMLTRDIKDEGNYALEFCTNDPSKESSPDTCAEGTSYKVQIYRYPNLPPKPYIGLRYNNPIGGFKDHRVIKDPVNMDVSLTCPRKEGLDASAEALCDKIISDTVTGDNTITANDFRNACCVENWEDQYCVKYRWELIETPTPLAPETRITLDNIPDSGEGSWYLNCGGQDPTLASFKGYMITPTPDNKSYKVQIQAVTIDKQTQLDSDITEKIDIPNIIPSARVMVQLTWKEGLQTRAEKDRQEGVAVDIDLHLVKKQGMDSCQNLSGADGLLCTSMGTPLYPDLASPSHDDCHFNDTGCNGDHGDCNQCSGGEPTSDFRTIAWYAALDLDNTWGGGGYTNPETINMGPIDDDDHNGQPDVNPFTDQYLVIVNYNLCQNLVEGGSNADCEEGGAYYNAHAKVEIFIDGDKAPRPHKEGRPDDDDPLVMLEFVIRPNEWIVVDHIFWDQSLTTGKWGGDGYVRNPPADYRVCNFDLSYCHNTPIWDVAAYETWVGSDPNVDPYVGGAGSCYDYGTRQ